MSPSPSPPADDRRARRREHTRGALVAAARQLFAAQGFDATSVAQIGQAADTAHGSFYNYFRTKDEILDAVFAETLSEQFTLLQERRRGIEDPAERVSIAHRHLLAAARAQPDWGWIVVRVDVPLRIVERVLHDPAIDDLRAGLRSGRFRVPDPEVAVYASGGALLSIMRLALRDALGEDADRAHATGVLCSFGLAPEAAKDVVDRPLPAP